MVPVVGLQCVIVVFPGHTHLLLSIIPVLICKIVNIDKIESNRVCFHDMKNLSRRLD